ncbi:hypothetical protein [Croceicoccus gelatinilyticus]|uniref:hypothetical protein n=1 Tax=Croceicoccus gelatinilyticus TaxID=2835536 RepID=UPI001BCF5ECD|nr:hypothetical protein [Croceicoccus gelatinilyticus]MBS7671402.1 hypothetical protein [Croceicoccus gelatinilyticus]
MKLDFDQPILSGDHELDVGGLSLKATNEAAVISGRLKLEGGPADAETAAEISRYFAALSAELAAREEPANISEADGPPPPWMGKAFD